MLHYRSWRRSDHRFTGTLDEAAKQEILAFPRLRHFIPPPPPPPLLLLRERWHNDTFGQSVYGSFVALHHNSPLKRTSVCCLPVDKPAPCSWTTVCVLCWGKKIGDSEPGEQWRTAASACRMSNCICCFCCVSIRGSFSPLLALSYIFILCCVCVTLVTFGRELLSVRAGERSGLWFSPGKCSLTALKAEFGDLPAVHPWWVTAQVSCHLNRRLWSGTSSHLLMHRSKVIMGRQQ